MSTKNSPIIIGVTGGSGSGKTTVSQKILEELHGHSISIIQQDSYYKDQAEKTMEERREVNYDHPLAFDADLLYEHLKMLKNNQKIEVPIYDYKISTRSSEVIEQDSTDVIILEGILILADERIRDMLDIKVYVDTDDDIRIIRRIRRDMEQRARTLDSIINQYLTGVKPMYHQFIEPTKRYADVIVPEGGKNSVAIDLLVTKVRDILSEDGRDESFNK
ncbi:uridine kinase [Pediococcus pentosaceus]|uniref:uridine kinase n=1 Tax=Pediococcus pentosaceus TaxID=1255 RepID=UPI0021AE3751|nr:uridine kinase [Pediococcus pentosaceus]MCT1175913.1 uridine kinase [Pediococcus pentosaceus]